MIRFVVRCDKCQLTSEVRTDDLRDVLQLFQFWTPDGWHLVCPVCHPVPR